MDATTKTALALINAFLTIMIEQEYQNQSMTLEAVEFMVTAVRLGEEFDLSYVVNHYSTCIDSRAEAEPLITQIRNDADLLTNS